MSSYKRDTLNPATGKIEEAEWLDDYFGHYNYGVRFSDGKVYHPEEIKRAEKKATETTGGNNE